MKLDVFEGPLDLLLHLIEEEELSVYDVPIARITAQFLSYLAELEELDLDWAGEFILLAATLLEIKARELLPRPKPEVEEEPEEDPRAALIQRLLEYKQFKTASGFLAEQLHTSSRQHGRPAVLPEPPGLPEDVTLRDLVAAFRVVLEGLAPDLPAEIAGEEVTIREAMLGLVQALAVRPSGLPFRAVFAKGASRLHMVVCFLALLELVRLGRVKVRQAEPFGEILLFLVGGSANGREG